ncbi:MAG: PDZ domain-containing protein, partial [Acidobacteria bacterium]|nr:PDZ domain-containing protein [Acidobacteriota bacterium]
IGDGWHVTGSVPERVKQGVELIRPLVNNRAFTISVRAEVSLDGKELHTGEDLVSRVSETPVHQTVTLGVLRNGTRKDFRVQVEDRAKVYAERLGPEQERPGEPETGPVKFGVTIENLTSSQRDSLGLEEKGGVRVVEVQPGSFGEDIGVLAEDVIVTINRQPVNSASDVRRIQGSLKPGDAVAFRILRNAAPGARRGGRWTSLYLAGTLPR